MSNPLMSEGIYSKVGVDSNNFMTLDGTINKSFILVGLTILSAIGVWSYSDLFLPYILPIALIAFIIASIVIFAKKTSPYLSPIYAILEGLAIGVISAFYEKELPGIVIQAVSLTFGVFLIMLYLYKTKIIKATENFKSGVVASTGSIALIYIISLFGSFTGWYNIPFIHESGIYGILFSLFVVGIAALNLILDFDNVEIGVKMKAPKYMEWYTSFGLLVTLIWLYLEILKLLAKSRRR
ncbi:Bax inhibitor-1/YccA family protein [Candidatus Gracilibacteria bacterium]|nr:Bax inhibitor-1/YccA family protein [Candidatus Gracilibacteria bacterium]